MWKISKEDFDCVMMAFQISPSQIHAYIHIPSIAITSACLIIGWIILLSKYRISKREANHEKGTNVVNQITQKKQVDDTIEHSIRPIIGPKAPQEFTFLVNTPPTEHVPLHVGSKHKSIKRLIVINPRDMTWESRRPKKRISEVDHGERSALEFVKDEILPISALLSVSSQMPERSATVELTVDTSKKTEGVDDAENLLSNIVTMDNWKTFDFSNKKKNGSDTYADYEYEDEEDSFYDASTFLGAGREIDGNYYGSSSIAAASTTTEKTNTKSRNTRKNNHGVIMKEYTFAGEYDTGSFQTLHLALNSVGHEIRHMYSALEMIQKRSEARDGEVYGICDQCTKAVTGDESGKVIRSCPCTGVALDDVQRCLGGLPFIGKRISQIYDQCRSQVLTNNRIHETSDSLIVSAAANDEVEGRGDNSMKTSKRKRAEIYQDKRILLGYIDFFRLFIPTVFHGTPYGSPVATKGPDLGLMDGLDVHQARVKQLMKLQQRVASAAVNVRSYTNAMDIVHEGWKLEFPAAANINAEKQMTKRLAFDYDVLNAEYDSLAENEYYCPTLSRQNETEASSENRADSSSVQFQSCPQQAYALVACKLVNLPEGNEAQEREECPLTKSRDPVASIPSLHSIIEKNPKNEFFVLSLFYERKHAMMILLYVRCIPDGVDEFFDDAMETFANGSIEIRDEMLDLSMQIGPLKGVPYLQLWRRWRRTSGSPQQQNNSRINLPSATLSKLTRTKHFGGSQATETFLDNYLAVNCEVRTHKFFNSSLSYCERILYGLVPSIDGGPNPNIVDLAFIFHEVSRNVASIRLVFLDRTGGISWEDIIGAIHTTSLPLHDDSKYKVDTIEEFDEIEDEYKGDVESLKDILSCITIPARDMSASPNDVQSIAISTNNTSAGNVKFQDRQVLSFFDDHDIKRHLIGSKNNLKEAAIRITQCAAWRGITFPVDTRVCRIELMSGQFFHQGSDIEGNPVFYFRNMCHGLWRKDVNASTLAVLHRLERAFFKTAKSKRDFQCTLIVLMGRPVVDTEMDDSTINSSAETDRDDKGEETQTSKPASLGIDESTEKQHEIPSYHVHTNFKFAQNLINITGQNYPERLGKVLVVPNGGWEKFIGVHGLRRYVQSSRTRSKVKILDNMKELKNYISPDQLIDIAGGESPISPEAFGVN